MNMHKELPFPVALGIIGLFIVVIFWWASPRHSASVESVALEPRESYQVSEFKRLGYITSMDCSLHKAMVNVYYWRAMNYQEKANSTYQIAQSCKDGGGVRMIKILSHMDGKELGGLNEWQGFYVK